MDCESIPLSVSGVEEIGDRVLVVFDGHCGLCNRAVRWFLRRDGRDRLRFVASESEKVAGLLERLGVVAASGLGPGSILVVMDSACDVRPGIPADCPLALPDLGTHGELPFAYGRGARAVLIASGFRFSAAA